ncbi:hypothetical protein ACFL27_22140 [candidate division CSSED10-310 bacterium]|uniref:Uncharacterized protein n=1 Tax=candidate division CSSED10-310 bacterium TaxID=2855610 RepID=A0ABV6Z387_UNCC1
MPAAQLQFDLLHDASITDHDPVQEKLTELIEKSIDQLPQPYIRSPIVPAEIQYIYKQPNLYLFGDRMFHFDLPFPVLYTFFCNPDWGDTLMGGFFRIKKEDTDYFTIKWSAFRGTVEVSNPTEKTIQWHLKGKLLGLYTVESITILSFHRCFDSQTFIYGWNVGCFPMSQFAARAIEKIFFLLKYPAASTVEVVASKVEHLVEKIKQASPQGSRYNVSADQRQEILKVARKLRFPVEM